jgi:hypothetical protein
LLSDPRGALGGLGRSPKGATEVDLDRGPGNCSRGPWKWPKREPQEAPKRAMGSLGKLKEKMKMASNNGGHKEVPRGPGRGDQR